MGLQKCYLFVQFQGGNYYKLCAMVDYTAIPAKAKYIPTTKFLASNIKSCKLVRPGLDRLS